MPLTLFYSWQNDTPTFVGRWCIQAALEQALLQVGRARPQHAPLCFDQDTEGAPGTPEVTTTTLKKIEACSLFVPDLTCVARTSGGKLIPNPNVMIALGYALKTVGSDRIIPVMNEAFGTAAQGLPFNLAHRRWPIRYTLPENAPFARWEQIQATLVTEVEQAIVTVLQHAGLWDDPPPSVYETRGILTV